MAERLTECIDSHLLDNGEMVKEYSLNKNIKLNHFSCMDIPNAVYDKLGELEDIMEKYSIESLDTLEHIIKKGQVINTTIEGFAKEAYDEMQTDRDYWKRACELACEYMCKFVIPCPDIHRKECKSFCDLNKADCYQDYFYQQAKKEKDGDNNDTNN